MTPTPEVEAKGMKAYEQARAFERMRAWRLPLSYGVLVAIPGIWGLFAMSLGHVMMAESQFVLAILFAVGVWLKWRSLKQAYAQNLELLAEMEGKYGDQLPWVQVKKHFAALEKLQQELVEEKQARLSE